MSGGKFKAWHLILIVAGIAALAWGGYRLMSSGGGTKANWAKSSYGVDVVTGQVYRYAISRGVGFPAVSPTTGELTIFPAEQNPETGKWYITPRARGDVRQLGAKAKALSDPSTGEVTTTGEVVSGN